MAGPLDWASAQTQAAREISVPTSFESTLDTIVRVAQRSMPGIDHVGISTSHGDGSVETLAATDRIVLELDRLQHEAGEGPCLQALVERDVVRVEAARHEQRWPGFIPAAVRLGLRSQLGVPLHVDDRTLGALNIYSTTTDLISDETERLAEVFATHAALALGNAERLQELSAALASRTTVGVALGILMQRLDMDVDTAFAHLTRVSSTTERKLRDVAAEIVGEHADGLD